MNSAGVFHFVGRESELSALLSLCARGQTALAWVSGAGGIGKTTLLREVCRRARLDGKKVVSISVDRTNSTPRDILLTASATLGEASDLGALLAGGHLLVLDALESATWLEGWLLDELSQAPSSGGVVLVGSREAPSLGWLSPHLSGRLLHLPLAPFDARECEVFLGSCGIEEPRHGELGEFSRGHPLTLAILAQSSARTFSPRTPDEHPALLQAILSGIIERSLAPRQRAALEAAAQVPVFNEPLLRTLLDDGEIHDLLAWLQSRPYTTLSAAGLHLHDLVVDVVSAELRWRDPARAAVLSARAFEHLSGLLADADPQTQRRAGDALVWMCKRLPGTEGAFSSAQHDLYFDTLRDVDVPRARDLVARADGPEACAIWERYRRERPGSLGAVRGVGHELKSFWVDLVFPSDDLQACSFDPAITSVGALVAELGLSPRAVVSVQRWYIDAESLREPGVTMNLSTIRELRAMVSVPGLQMRIFVAPADCYWGPRWEAFGYQRHARGVSSIGGRAFDCWFVDFRVRSPVAYLRSVFAGNMPTAQTPEPPALVSISRGEVRASLQALRDPGALAQSPLLAFVLGDELQERAVRLRDLLTGEINALGATTRGQKMRRALWATYLEPPASQEEIAERLRLPFRTYRDHLSMGLDELTKRLPAALRAAPVAIDVLMGKDPSTIHQ